MLSQYSLLRNRWLKPIGVLEHCREGGTISWFSFFGALSDGNKIRKLCLLSVYFYGMCVGADPVFSCGCFCDFVNEVQRWVIGEGREVVSGRSFNQILYNSRYTQLLCRRFSTSEKSRCGDWSRVTDYSENCNASNVIAKQSKDAVLLHYNLSQRGCLFTSQHGVTFHNTWVIINTVVWIGVLKHHLVFVTERESVFTRRNRMFILCVIYISD